MSQVLPFAPEAPWLAPLAGYSDLAFRLLCRENGAACAVTEMVSAKGLVYGSPGTAPLLTTCPEDKPLVVQLFGDTPDILARAMDLLLDQGFRWFDLNCGCAVPKVVRGGCGAALLRNPDQLVASVAAMVQRAEPGRVGVKLRLGWTASETCHLTLGPRLEQVGVGWLSLHPRTARQGFSGRADWSQLAALRHHVALPVLASGDLFTAADAARCLEETGVAGVMFARGALADPTIFARLAARLAGAPLPRLQGPELATLIRRHATLIRCHDTPRRGLLRMRSIVPRYVKHLPSVSDIRQRLMACRDWECFEHVVTDIAQLATQESG